MEFATLEWVDRFNNRRLHEPIVNIPAAEAEARHHTPQEPTPLAAEPTPNSLRQTRRGSPFASANALLYAASTIVLLRRVARSA
ncbi:hypothetical protein GCM10010964_39450 [Caldovatus sediminis]|uniref:Integrase catalytic domain-containing protein n=1 Tax=Caldovatus sediminis TaxID=2041189 RepID=A0A8J2ZEK1_9PROT|nr:hypothetical protein GCM10010964_39450 [Caldovatus sediminis]